MHISEILNRIKDRSGQRSRSMTSSSKSSVTCFNCFSSSSSSSSENSIDAGLTSGQILQNVNAFTYSELELATNGFHSSLKIGEGGFGSVYKGRLREGRTVAIKVLSVDSEKGQRDFMSEIVSMANISHGNLVKLLGGCVHGPLRILVYDCMENGNLAETLLGGKNARFKFCWETRREISLGIARALAYIHEEIKPHIVHRDIKASNILLDQNFIPKISDFGLSKLFPKNVSRISTRVAGTLGYLAPEYAVSGHLTRKSDVYSFGVLLLEIVSGRKAVDFDLQLGEHYLVEKAWEMYRDSKLLQLVDPMLKGDFLEAEAIRFLRVGLLCVQETCGLRPNMSMALKMMRNEVKTHNKEIAQPGLITDFRDVKIGRKKKRVTPKHHQRVQPSYTCPFSHLTFLLFLGFLDPHSAKCIKLNYFILRIYTMH